MVSLHPWPGWQCTGRWEIGAGKSTGELICTMSITSDLWPGVITVVFHVTSGSFAAILRIQPWGFRIYTFPPAKQYLRALNINNMQFSVRHEIVLFLYPMQIWRGRGGGGMVKIFISCGWVVQFSLGHLFPMDLLIARGWERLHEGIWNNFGWLISYWVYLLNFHC